MVSGGASSAPQFPATAVQERFGRSKCRQFEVVAGIHSTITFTPPPPSLPPSPLLSLARSLARSLPPFPLPHPSISLCLWSPNC